MSAPALTVAGQRRLNPRKLLLSKWTAVHPQNREKHFLVSQLFSDDNGNLLQIELQAVHSQRCQRLDWRVLQDPEHWHIGWT
jgi:tryptophan-rich hypothetical protein